jgi:hypothetical protein
MTDVAFLGRVGEVELGAAALAGVFFLMLMMFGMGYGFGVQAHMSRKNGEKGDVGHADELLEQEAQHQRNGHAEDGAARIDAAAFDFEGHVQKD